MSTPSTASTEPDLLYSEEEEALRAAVRDLLTDHCDPAGVITRMETDTPHDLSLWKSLTEGMGLAGLLVPEEQGGQGASHREVAVVLEELGRAVAPVPYLTSAVVATEALLACTGDAAGELLAALASGRTVGALAVALNVAPGGAYKVVPHEGGLLHGELTGIADATVADVLLVPADDGGLYAVDTDANAVTVTPQVSLDLTRPVATITFDGASARLLGDAEPAVRRALRAGAGLLASEQLGLADWALTETVRYLKDRKQFNRPVGGFQAVKHRLAQLWLEVVGAARRRPERGGRPRHRQRGRRRGGRRRPVLRGSRGRPRRRGGTPAARRHRHDLGAPDPPVPQAGQGRLDRVRHVRRPPRRPRRTGRPARPLTHPPYGRESPPLCPRGGLLRVRGVDRMNAQRHR